MIRRSVTLVGAALAAFHVWLFAGQLWSGALADPGLIVRWLVAAGLIAGLVAIRRQGESVLLSRKSIAIWVLAALLHGPALAARIDSAAAPIPDVVVTMAQTVAGLLALFGLGLGVTGPGVRRRPVFRLVGLAAVRSHVPALDPGAGVSFAPRPPPLG
jgi:hypothetical protein